MTEYNTPRIAGTGDLKQSSAYCGFSSMFNTLESFLRSHYNNNMFVPVQFIDCPVEETRRAGDTVISIRFEPDQCPDLFRFGRIHIIIGHNYYRLDSHRHGYTAALLDTPPEYSSVLHKLATEFSCNSDVYLTAQWMAEQFVQRLLSMWCSICNRAALEEMRYLNEALHYVRGISLRNRMFRLGTLASLAGAEFVFDGLEQVYSRSLNDFYECCDDFRQGPSAGRARLVLTSLSGLVEFAVALAGLEHGLTRMGYNGDGYYPGDTSIIIEDIMFRVSFLWNWLWVTAYPVLKDSSVVCWHALTQQELTELLLNPGLSVYLTTAQAAGGTIRRMLHILHRLLVEEPQPKVVNDPASRNGEDIVVLVYNQEVYPCTTCSTARSVDRKIQRF